MPDLPSDHSPELRQADASPDNVVPFPTAPKKPITADELVGRLASIESKLGRLDGIESKLDVTLNHASTLMPTVGRIASWVDQQASQPAVDKVVAQAIGVEALRWTHLALTRERQAEARARQREQAIEDRARQRADDLQQQLAELAGKVELLASPNRNVAELAGEVANGNAEAIDQLASVVHEQPSWWQRHRGWAIPVAIALGCALLVVIGVKYEQARRVQVEDERRRREIEARYRDVEQRYLALHAAYAEAQRALAAERMRPLQAFHTHDIRHEEVYDCRSVETTNVADPEDVAALLLPHLPHAEDVAARVAALIPASTTTTIVQPTKHTVRTTTKTKVVRVRTCERAAAQARAAAEQAKAAAAAAKRDREAAERTRQRAQRDRGAATIGTGGKCRPNRQPSRLLEAAIEVARKEPPR